ncbi:MAG: sugar phosphate isomerase/epimerase [Lachnospiraceae bacterium]|nr:sugar phosphate isomerase/epimerase [Lachnospiraceae bacterium]
MGKLYLVPDRTDMERVCSLAEDYGCAFEYNDFYAAEVMDDPKRQEKIITSYGRYRGSFMQDTMHGAFLDVTIHSSDPLIREASMLRVRQSMEIAARMKLRGVVFHTGRLANFRVASYLDNWREKNAVFFTELAAQYPNQQIYMENMFDEAPDIMAGLAEQLRDVENFGICLDYAHAMLSGRSGQEWIETLAPYIRHIHINDNDLVNDLHLPVGDGRLDFQEFDRLIRRYRIDVPVLVEVSGYEAQRKSLEYMTQHGIYPMDAKENDSAFTV